MDYYSRFIEIAQLDKTTAEAVMILCCKNIFSRHGISEEVRVQRFRLWMLRFNFSIAYVPGINLVIADTHFRAPLMAPDQQDKHFKEDVQAYVDVIVQDLLATEQRFEEIQHAQENDPL